MKRIFSSIRDSTNMMLRSVCLLALAATQLSAAHFPLRWRWSNPLPHGNNILDMAYSPTNGLWVQVGERGQIYTSVDLVFWIPRDSGTTLDLRAITFLGGRIIVTGENGTVLYADSPDNFRPGRLADGPTPDWLEGVAASPSKVVAVGDNGAIYVSNEGTNWTRQTTSFDDWLRSVAFGAGGFVAVGENGVVATSSGGSNWTRRNSGVNVHLNRVVFANSRYTAVGDDGLVIASTTGGLSWSPVTSGATNDLFTVTEADSTRLVAGQAQVRMESAGTWSDELAKTNGPTSWTYLSSVGRPDFYLLGGRTGLMSEGYRTNGSPYFWLPSDLSIRHWQFEVLHLPGLYVTVGDRATVLASQDGIEWSLEVVPSSPTNSTFLGVGGTTNLLVAVGDDGSLMFSPNTLIEVTNQLGSNQLISSLGVVWQAVEPPPTPEDLQGVTYGHGRYVVTGGAGTVLTSPDGTNWTPGTTPTTRALLSSVVSYPGGFVAVGTGGAILHSPDGTDWTALDSGTTNWLYRVRHLGGRLISVGQNGWILTSTNGTNWAHPSSGSAAWLTDVALVGDTYFIVGSQGTVLSSTNAVEWTERGTITYKSLYGVATDGRQLVAVGIEGIILRSQVVPSLTPVNILRFSRTVSTQPPLARNLYLFGGQPDQRFTLDFRGDLTMTNLWGMGPQLEFYDSTGLLHYLETFPGTNFPAREFYRTTLAP